MFTRCSWKGAETSAEKFTGDDGEKLLQDMADGWERAESVFRQLRDFMANDLKVYADKVIRSYTSLIPLFDFLYHNPKPNETSRALMRGYHYKAQLFGWYSQSTDTVVNALHGIVGKPSPYGFPIQEFLEYFQRRGNQVELRKSHLTETRLRFILLNLVYVDQMGASPFDVKYKGNEPHVDHIYPRRSITKLGLAAAEVNHIGNYRFVGATDNIRKRGELPSSYFTRLKTAGTGTSKHLLLDDFSQNPDTLLFDIDVYKEFRDARLERIWHIAKTIVNPENEDI